MEFIVRPSLPHPQHLLLISAEVLGSGVSAVGTS